MAKDELIENELKALQGFFLFVKNNPWATVFGILAIAILLSIGLLTFYSFTMINHLVAQEDLIHVTPEKLQDSLEKTIIANGLIDDELESLRIDMGADRAYLMKFHNSYTDIAGRHFYYFTNTNERVSPGTSREINEYQRAHISTINDWMKELIKGDCISTPISLLDKDSLLYERLKSQGTNYIGLCPMFDITGSYLEGFIGVDYVSHDKPLDATCEPLRHSALKISGLLAGTI